MNGTYNESGPTVQDKGDFATAMHELAIGGSALVLVGGSGESDVVSVTDGELVASGTVRDYGRGIVVATKGSDSRAFSASSPDSAVCFAYTGTSKN